MISIKTATLMLICTGPVVGSGLWSAAWPGVSSSAGAATAEKEAPADEMEQPALVVSAEHRHAVETGLLWLADHQNDDGSWSGKVGYKLRLSATPN